MKSGMSIERALELQLAHVRDRGETLEGYMNYYSPANHNIRDADWIGKRWAEGTNFLNALVRAALLKNSGHHIGDVDTILRNKAFFEKAQPNRKG